MANTISQEVQNAIDNLEKASDGASMRKAIIEALRAVNDNGGNAVTFNGHYADYFLWKDTFLKQLKAISNMLDKFDENPTFDSTALVQSGNVNNYLNALIDRLAAINGGEGGKHNKVVAAELKILTIVKNNIATAIQDMGGTIEELDSFEDYAKRIKNLHISKFEEVEFTKNETKRAPSDTFYSIAHVNVQPVVEPKVITAEGEYEVPSGVDAWNPVYIQVPGASNYNSGGTYNPGASGSHSSADSADYDLEDLDVTSNGTYNATEGKSAIGSVNVHVNALDPETLSLMKFTVTFQNYDGEVLDIQKDIIGGHAAFYQGESGIPTKPSSDGRIWTFSHWDPSPSYVDRDMTCVAQFTEALYSSFDDPDYSWEDICTGSASPNVGDMKILNLNPYVGPKYDHGSGGIYGNTLKFGPIMMQCVSRSESSGSTWISLNLLSLDDIVWAGQRINYDTGRQHYCQLGLSSGYIVGDRPDNGFSVSGEYAVGHKLGWLNSPLRVWLNTEFYEQCLPDIVRDSVKPVTKTTYTIMSTDTSNHDVLDAYNKVIEGKYADGISPIAPLYADLTSPLTNQKVWIPSNREIWGSFSKTYGKSSDGVLQTGSAGRTLPVEYSGIRYSSAYGNYFEPNASDWMNNRVKAVGDMYRSHGDNVAMKHLSYYPYDDMADAGRPYISNMRTQASFLWRSWPTRTSLSGNFFEINNWGNSKADLSSVANEKISESYNLLQSNAYYGSMNRNGLGICFGFIIG